MGTTHVVSNALDSPDPRAKALQRVDVRAGRWLINGVINGGDALADGAGRLGYGQGDSAVAALVSTAFRAGLHNTAAAPVFIPHTRPERGPLWLADALDRDILVVDESHLPAVGAAAMCAEVLDGQILAPPEARRVIPRPEWRETVDERWQQYRQMWSAVTGVPPLSTLDDALADRMPS